jgi:hypothetical protein
MFKALKQQELHCMIVEILWRNPNLKYYQVSNIDFINERRVTNRPTKGIP